MTPDVGCFGFGSFTTGLAGISSRKVFPPIVQELFSKSDAVSLKTGDFSLGIGMVGPAAVPAGFSMGMGIVGPVEGSAGFSAGIGIVPRLGGI